MIKMKKIKQLLSKIFRVGRCMSCGKWTSGIARFSDDPDDNIGYFEYCHDECYEQVLEAGI